MFQGRAETAVNPEDTECILAAIRRKERRLHGQAVKTSPFHGGNTGSIPVGVIFAGSPAYNFISGAIAKW